MAALREQNVVGEYRISGKTHAVWTGPGAQVRVTVPWGKHTVTSLCYLWRSKESA